LERLEYGGRKHNTMRHRRRFKRGMISDDVA
jgi:hypothetical protein